MPIYRPTELKKFLSSLSTGPKKHLSQNFLVDGNILRKIVAVAQIQPNETILEIGPGPGALTECLLQASSKVVAVEKDTLLSQSLRRLAPIDQLQIFTEDILEFSFEKHLSFPTKVIANLPYHLTAPILGRLVPKTHLFNAIYVMVQEEVARRMTAVKGSSDYSSLSVFLQFYSKPAYCFGVSRKCFYPVPKVDSAVVELTLKTPPKDIDSEAFLKLVHLAFNQRRKTLRASLKETYGADVIEKALAILDLAPTTRPEEMTLEDWLKLFQKI